MLELEHIRNNKKSEKNTAKSQNEIKPKYTIKVWLQMVFKAVKQWTVLVDSKKKLQTIYRQLYHQLTGNLHLLTYPVLSQWWYTVLKTAKISVIITSWSSMVIQLYAFAKMSHFWTSDF